MKKEPEKVKEEPSSMFQRQRVDMLLGELMRKFPLPMLPNPNAPPAAVASGDQPPQRPDLKETNATAATTNTAANLNGNNNQNGEFKPPEKRAK